MSESWGFETKQVHAGATPDPTTGARAVPIYQTTSFVFRDTAHAAALFGLEELGMIYTRIMNPTQAVFEERVTALEGGVGALAVASGQAAQFQALMNLAENGGHIVSSASLYGGTYNQLHYTFPKLGVEVSFIDDPDDLDAWRAAIRPNTKAFYGEIIGNPKGDVFDLEGVSGGRARQRHPARDRQHAGDAVPVPAARARRRHRRALGDEVHRRARHVDRRDHRRRRQVRLRGERSLPGVHRTRPELPRPDLLAASRGAAPGAVHPEGRGCSTSATSVRRCRRSTSSSSCRGSRRLSLRMERHSQNALAIAEWLEARDEVEWVKYPGLASSPWNERAKKYLPNGVGAIVVVRDQGWDERRARSSWTRSSCTATSPTWATCAAWPSTPPPPRTRSSSPRSRWPPGVTDDLVRLSVGIESLPDIQADLEAGFRAAKA